MMSASAGRCSWPNMAEPLRPGYLGSPDLQNALKLAFGGRLGIVVDHGLARVRDEAPVLGVDAPRLLAVPVLGRVEPVVEEEPAVGVSRDDVAGVDHELEEPRDGARVRHGVEVKHDDRRRHVRDGQQRRGGRRAIEIQVPVPNPHRRSARIGHVALHRDPGVPLDVKVGEERRRGRELGRRHRRVRDRLSGRHLGRLRGLRCHRHAAADGVSHVGDECEARAALLLQLALGGDDVLPRPQHLRSGVDRAREDGAGEAHQDGAQAQHGRGVGPLRTKGAVHRLKGEGGADATEEGSSLAERPVDGGVEAMDALAFASGAGGGGRLPPVLLDPEDELTDVAGDLLRSRRRCGSRCCGSRCCVRHCTTLGRRPTSCIAGR
mmetsp:Transcript_6000/g.18943  ORF Transcript_6000/g.18943 Transcript_6000/m.18943 type:complete len:378 (-) Transcript_6000:439-1572(-)